MPQSAADAVLREAGRGARGRRGEQSARRTQRETVSALSVVPLFASLSKKHLERLARETDRQTYAPGVKIVEEGLLGETLFVVLEGRGKITRGGKKVGEVLPGDFFGELSALDGGPRSATITAVTPVTVLRLFRRTLLGALKDEPRMAIKLLDGMAARIRQVERGTG
ncbi:MAG TPA: cyclic nucleotide-binding domain-containing protein [Actinomycetota bacterium]|nr:cyclic nucleotide-binding domain-containing protein [Actinomycetota bacterium]